MLETQFEGTPKRMVYTLDAIDEAAAFVLRESSHMVLLFSGDMGAGKTTLIASILKQLGSIDRVSSPTFSIVNEYHCSDGRLVYHFDLYRIESIYELNEFGFDSYLNTNAYIFIEWPENLYGNQPLEVNRIFIEESAENERTLTLY